MEQNIKLFERCVDIIKGAGVRKVNGQVVQDGIMLMLGAEESGCHSQGYFDGAVYR